MKYYFKISNLSDFKKRWLFIAVTFLFCICDGDYIERAEKALNALGQLEIGRNNTDGFNLKQEMEFVT